MHSSLSCVFKILAKKQSTAPANDQFIHIRFVICSSTRNYTKHYLYSIIFILLLYVILMQIVEETPEEKERKKIKLMARVEFFACLQEEGKPACLFYRIII